VCEWLMQHDYANWNVIMSAALLFASGFAIGRGSAKR
jgi:hypothetical protein